MLTQLEDKFACLIDANFTLEPGCVGDYYLNFRPPSVYLNRDEIGIPLIQVSGFGLLHNWTVVQQEAIRRFQYWMDERSPSRLAEFLAVVRFCCDGLESSSSGGAGWYYRYPAPPYFFTSDPRMSGMSQGQGISVLVRASEATGNADYIVKAREAFALLVADIADGGARFVTPQGNWWYEERPKPDPPFTLNGFIYALLGLVDLYKVTGEPEHLQALERGIGALKELVGEFDRYCWSLYELKPYPLLARESYHLCHFNQLKALGYITGEGVFLDLSSKWQRQYDSLFFRGLNRIALKANGLSRSYRTDGLNATVDLVLRKLLSKNGRQKHIQSDKR